METLLNLMNAEIHKLNYSGFKKLEDFITKDSDSAKFMRTILNDPNFIARDEENIEASLAESRARHSALTYLMGLVFLPFYDFKRDLPADIRTSDCWSKLWLLVALYHDIGYFSDRIKNPNFEYSSFKYQLFTNDYQEELAVLKSFPIDYPSAFAYTYAEILSYDEYAKSYHAHEDVQFPSKSKECIDHGILGGAITFNTLVGKMGKEKGKQDLVISKYCSLTIAQHNIFKSSNKQQDEQYPELLRPKLSSDSSYRICKETPLLLFLCLVDTIEAVKKFSKKENNGEYLETLSTLKSIKAEINEGELILDLTELQKRTNEKNKDMKDAFKKYIKALRGIETWTDFHARQTNDPFMLKIIYQEMFDVEKPIAAMAKREDSYV